MTFPFRDRSARIQVQGGNPITPGMPDSLAAFIDSPIAFDTTAPGLEMNRWVLASYPADASKILLSGWIDSGAPRLAGKAAAVAMTYGKGHIVLFGFRPQFFARRRTPPSRCFSTRCTGAFSKRMGLTLRSSRRERTKRGGIFGWFQKRLRIPPEISHCVRDDMIVSPHEFLATGDTNSGGEPAP